MRGLRGALLRFRIMAWVTGIVLATMVVIFLPLKYVFHATTSGPLATAYSVGWVSHGWLYMLYVAAGLDICFRMRFSIVRTVAVLLAGTIPFASFFADHVVAKSAQQRIDREESATATAPSTSS